MSAMAYTTRIYAVGAERAEELALGSATDRLDEGSILWVESDRDEASLEEISQTLGLSDAIRLVTSRPDAGAAFRGEHIRLSVMGLRAMSDRPEAARLDILVAPNVVVSIHEVPIRGLSDPIDTVAEDPRFGGLDAGRFAGLLLDGVLDGYDAAVDEVVADIDRLDEAALRADVGADALETMVEIRRRIASMRRWLAPNRAVFAALTREIDDEPSPIGTPNVDLVAHLDRTLDAIDRCREQLLGSFDIVMTRTGQRTNDVMRVLTVLSAVLLPAVVIAGVMGMNFPAPMFDDAGLFSVVLGAMIALAFLTLAFARLRRWI
jgi:Mg2+ and Co2+ transporter CorA